MLKTDLYNLKADKSSIYDDEITHAIDVLADALKKKQITESQYSMLLQFVLKKKLKGDMKNYINHITRNTNNKTNILINYVERTKHFA